MRKDNPAIFECKAVRSGIHFWHRSEGQTCYCQHCNLKLSPRDTTDVFQDAFGDDAKTRGWFNG